MAPLRLRIAPSPTGPVHVGTAHTALFNWLWARSTGGTFVLRMEDTDRERSRPEWEQVIYDEMRWLGLDWDEGPDAGGAFGPYRQSERLHLYGQYLAKLQQSGVAYPCYCNTEELAQEREAAQRQNLTYKYSRRCRNLTAAERAQREAEGRAAVWRFAVPDSGAVAWDDLVRGPIEFQAEGIGDFVIMRANGVPLYNFAVVVDDITMQISHVVRGEDHISNTPVQLLIYPALGASPPVFGHLGNLTNPDRSKLSKRKGDAQIEDYRRKGILPQALFNFLALLGWMPRDEQEFRTQDDLIREFRMDQVSKAAAVFDMEKLEWMNGNYIRALRRDALYTLGVPFLVDAGLITATAAAERRDWVTEVLVQIQERVRTLGEIPGQTTYFFRDEFEMDPKAEAKFLAPAVKPFFSRMMAALRDLPQWEMAALEGAIRSLMAEMNLKPAESMQPLRVAVTGRTASPGLFETLHLVGRERVIARLGRYA